MADVATNVPAPLSISSQIKFVVNGVAGISTSYIHCMTSPGAIDPRLSVRVDPTIEDAQVEEPVVYVTSGGITSMTSTSVASEELLLTTVNV